MAAKDIEAAVRAAQLYHGSNTCMTARISDTQKLYNRLQRKVKAVAKRRGLDENDVYHAVTSEASKRGKICPIPGKDI